MKTEPAFLPSPTLVRWLFRSSVFLVALLGTTALAQSTGSVTGVVTDKATNGYLVGAEVRLAGTDLATATARDGTFTLANVPAGNQSLEVSYVGRKTKTVSVSVRAGAIKKSHCPLPAAARAVTRSIETLRCGGMPW